MSKKKAVDIETQQKKDERKSRELVRQAIKNITAEYEDVMPNLQRFFKSDKGGDVIPRMKVEELTETFFMETVLSLQSMNQMLSPSLVVIGGEMVWPMTNLILSSPGSTNWIESNPQIYNAGCMGVLLGRKVFYDKYGLVSEDFLPPNFLWIGIPQLPEKGFACLVDLPDQSNVPEDSLAKMETV